jgi:hypothetical protein
MSEWTWTCKSEPYSKSARRIKIDTATASASDTNEDPIDNAQHISMFEYDWTNATTNASTNNQNNTLYSSPNKREDSYNRMSEREPICQLAQNPFMNESYTSVIDVQDSFLKSKEMYKNKSETN